LCDVDVSKFRFSFENFRDKKTYDLKIIIINHYFLIQIKFQFLKKCIHQINFLSTCNIEKNFASMMKIETINCFLTTQSIVSSNNLKMYSSAFFRSRSFAKKAFVVLSKICLSLFLLFDDVFLFNFKFDVDNISLFEFEIWLLSFSFFKFE
jgi:hypothetical protein